MAIVAPSPPGEQEELQALIEEARRRARRRRRRFAFAFLVLLAVTVGGYLLATRVYGRTTPAAAGIAGAPAPAVPVGSPPFWYMRTMGTMRHPWCVKQQIIRPGYYGRCEVTVWFQVGMSSETWVGSDGTMRERTVEDWQRFASAADRAKWQAHRKGAAPPVTVDQGDGLVIAERHFPPDLFYDNGGFTPPMEGPPTGSGPPDIGDSFFTYGQLLALPDVPAAAAGRIDQAYLALYRRYAKFLARWHSPGARLQARRFLTPQPRRLRSLQELTMITHLLSAPVPPRVRLALFHAATALPGVTVAPGARDPLGRTGVMVSAAYPDWQSVAFIFDSQTGELMTGSPFNGGPPDVAGPQAVVVAQGQVDSVTALPPGVKPIRAVSDPPFWPAPPPPRMIALSPMTGHAHTAFTLALEAFPGERVHRPPTVTIGISDSAGATILHRGKTRVDPCLVLYSPPRVTPAATTRRAGTLVYLYRLGPRLFHRRSWCSGRYALSLQWTPSPIPRRYTTPPYVGPSGNSIYFRVS